MSPQFITPAITVFDSVGQIDPSGNEKLYDHLINGGIDGIVVMGSSGEFPALTKKEMELLAETAIACVKGRAQILVGASRMQAEETIEVANFALKKGADAVMIISPYYFPVGQENLLSYYDRVAAGVDGPILLYHYPSVTGCTMTAETVRTLAQRHDNIVGLKDTVTAFGHTRQLLNTVLPVRPEFRIYSGFDEFFALTALSGGAGAIGGLSNLIPAHFSAWREAILSGDITKMTELQQKTNQAMALYDISSPFIPAMKRVLKWKGIIPSDTVRLPLLPLNQTQEASLNHLMTALNL